MNNKYEIAVNAVKVAEDALEVLKQCVDEQYKAKGETMLEQVINYITDALSRANHNMSYDVRYGKLGLTLEHEGFNFYIYAHYGKTCIFSIPTSPKSKTFYYIKDLKDWMMCAIVDNWEEFKKELNDSIDMFIECHVKEINRELSRIKEVNEKLAKWHV